MIKPKILQISLAMVKIWVYGLTCYLIFQPLESSIFCVKVAIWHTLKRTQVLQYRRIESSIIATLANINFLFPTSSTIGVTTQLGLNYAHGAPPITTKNTNPPPLTNTLLFVMHVGFHPLIQITLTNHCTSDTQMW